MNSETDNPRHDVLASLGDRRFLKAFADRLRAMKTARPLTFMHVCGTHEHTIGRAGLRSVLPDGIRLVAGPGCPVCVCPAGDIDLAVEAARRDGVVVATFGDMFRVPSTETSLEEAKAAGADVRIVYSPVDAVEIARREPGREVVFMAVGFETTAAPIAATVLSSRDANFSIIPSMRLIPPALDFLLARGGTAVDGFILPGHVSAIIGRAAYGTLEERGVPGVIAGFEAVDVVRAVIALVEEAERGGPGRVMNLYGRFVAEEGNTRAREVIDTVFERRDSRWRGIGGIPGSGLSLRAEYSRFDAETKLGLESRVAAVDVLPGCICHKVILGEAEPEQCRLFGATCTPRRPFGPCMVSSEGTCRARFEYRRPGVEPRAGL